MKHKKSTTRILAVSSGGGHWIQLNRLRPAFEGCDIAFATVKDDSRMDVEGHRFYRVNDATRWSKLGLIRLAFQMLWVVLRERPDVVISTGAAPGFFAVVFGKLLGARTVWLDTIALVEHLSMCGQKIGRFADLWLTQWPDNAREDGPQYVGAVL